MVQKQKKISIRVNDISAGARLDKALKKELTSLSREKIQNLIIKGLVTVDGFLRKPSYSLKKDQQIEVVLPHIKNELKPFDFKVNIIYEDDSLLVVEKPAGLTVHPPHFDYGKTLVSALLFLKKDLYPSDPLRPGVVHRLDKETTGLIVLAKNKLSYESLVEQFKSRKVKKEYRAISHGLIKQDSLRLDLPLARDSRNPLKMKVSFLKSKNAQTDIKVLQRLKDSSYISLKILTGRMHQIRVHLKFLGNPILGDKKYGIKDKCSNFFLHAHNLGFVHPGTGKAMEFNSQLPEYFLDYLRLNK